MGVGEILWEAYFHKYSVDLEYLGAHGKLSSSTIQICFGVALKLGVCNSAGQNRHSLHISAHGCLNGQSGWKASMGLMPCIHSIPMMLWDAVGVL